MGGCKSLMLFLLAVSFVLGGRGLATLLLFLLCYGRSGEDMCTGYAMAASGRMQYDYKQTNSWRWRSQRGRVRSAGYSTKNDTSLRRKTRK